MSSMDIDISKKLDRGTFELDTDEKSIVETTTSENSLSEASNKKRKLSNSRSKKAKKLKCQISVQNTQDLDTSIKETGIDIPQHRQQSQLLIGVEIHDIYCWICHKTENTVECNFCPRSFHTTCVSTCLQQTALDRSDWICPECVSVMVAECTLNIAPKWKNIAPLQLSEMLLFVLLRLYHISGSSHFHAAVDDLTIKDYYTIIKYPVYLDLIKQKVLDHSYVSVQGFHSDFKWILHNCTIYNGVTSVMTSYAKNIDKVCTKEINLLRSCPECFQQRMPFMIKLLKDQNKTSPSKSSTGEKGWEFSVEEETVNEMWMTKLCSSVHSLVWVRLHNYPVWPGKLISLDDESALVLFFGDYDLNIVPLGSICLHTQSHHKRLLANIANFSNRRTTAPLPSANSVSKEYQLALEQLNMHLDCIRKKYEYFVIPPKKIEFNIQAGVDYYEKLRLQSNLETDVIVVNSIEDIGLIDDISETAISERMDFRNDLEKCDKVEENVSMSLVSNCHFSKNVSQPDSSSGIAFIKSFESGLQTLLTQLKMECVSHLKLTNPDIIMEDEPLQVSKFVNQCQDAQLQTETVSVSNVSVQFSSKEFEKEEELKNYIKYLEKSLAAAEIEIRRQEIWSAIRHEENILEFSKQQKEIQKMYENDFGEVLKIVRGKFDEKFCRVVQKVKSNEWCAFCSKLAKFYCCWNTCYCNYECQSKHWEMHKSVCTQVNRSIQPVILPKNAYPPSTANNISSVMQQMISRNGDLSGLNGSNVIDYASNISHKQRLPLKR